MQEIAIAVGIGTGTGVVSLGILYVLFRRIFQQLDSKVDKPVFREYCVRIEQNLDRGSKAFEKLDTTTGELFKVVTDLCKMIIKIESKMGK